MLHLKKGQSIAGQILASVRKHGNIASHVTLDLVKQVYQFL